MGNILIVTLRGNIIGDSMREEALFHKYLSGRKDSKIIYTGSPYIEQLFENNPGLLEFVKVEEFRHLSKPISKLKKLFFLLKGYFKLKKYLKQKYSGEVDVGIITTKQFFRGILIKKLYRSLKVSVVEEGTSTYYKGMPSTIYFSKKEEREYSNKFKEILKNKYVFIQCDASSRDKALTLNYINQLLPFLFDKRYIVVLGGVTTFGEEIIPNKKLYDVIKKTTVREAAYLMKNSALAITNDSGLAHIGAAANANLIVLTPFDNLQIHNNPKKSKVIKLRNPKLEDIMACLKDEI